MLYDINGTRFCQGTITLFLLISYFLNWMPLTILVALVMWAGAVSGVEKAGLFYLLYIKLIRPVFKLISVEKERDPLELRFAQGLGAVFLTLAATLFYLGLQSFAWIIVLLVAALSFLAAFGFCLGAIIYVGIKKTFIRRV
jgi:uncharacterized membrane protein YagU involved in acid resistance